MNNSTDSIADYRRQLADNLAASIEAFNHDHDAAPLVRSRVALVDSLLHQAWQQFIPAHSKASLIAAGGYGRTELLPGSDIDLLILWQDENDHLLQQALESLLTFLWDIGLQVGHSVRTLQQCREEAENDITVVTNLMETRLLAGDSILFEKMLEITGPDNIWPCDRFFAAKLKEQAARHARYDDTISTLEPNIKESPGGLRDLHMIGWVAKRYFGAAQLSELVTHRFITRSEYNSLLQAQNLLWNIRFALHTVTGKQEDRLLFEHQRTLAVQFGYQQDEHNLAVEQFMRAYYKNALLINRLNGMLLQLFEEAILARSQQQEIIDIDEDFQSVNGFISAPDSHLFSNNPLALLRLFKVMESHPEIKGVRAETVRLIRNNRHRIDSDFRQRADARQLFMQIFRQANGQGLTHALRRMNQFGILAAYLPAFANIVGRMQYDLFHRYTVDVHTLFVVRNLRRFVVPEHFDEFPLCSDIIQQLDKPELLYLAGLFHDIAKGRGGDHSTLGEQDAIDFGIAHGLPEADYHLIGWLVREHLNMSMTAQQKDIADPVVIQAFAQKVGDQRHLDYLYLLTVADARATNPKRWNSWKDSLLKALYQATSKMLAMNNDDQAHTDSQLAETHRKAARLLENSSLQPSDISAFWLTLSEDYFLYSQPERIAWHTETILQANLQGVISIRHLAASGVSEILQFTSDQPGLFCKSATVLDQLRLAIVEARLLVTDQNFALNSYTVLDPEGLLQGIQAKEVIEKLNHIEQVDLQAYQSIQRRIPRQLQQFQSNTRISFEQDPACSSTLLVIKTADRPGLLAHIGRILLDCNTLIQNASISTIGAEVEDSFQIVTHKGDKLPADGETMNCIRDHLMQEISNK
ncbi:MAG: [protein-PII] uridylyltransferase [gamma proteobacterium symbiont of Bathyaustriella thionipta]|nr:[protein-PII] uridylyltransferase [gamma proteobacterium symbiont of Bathyaustriella thionipta]